MRTGSTGLRPYPDALPDPRSRRGRRYTLTAILLVCACAAVSGARSIDELAEWGERASSKGLAALGIRQHLLGWRRDPSPTDDRARMLGAAKAKPTRYFYRLSWIASWRW
ncbi:transposase family protein [Streptomyces sp. NBC_01727]|uniref:transposase family protein n=1 Tax=Streptomyces sp. NBC_01727 TaxID=2975924 RepID=UPI002E11B0DE|nr:transposase family protein [Streptomyces sp. NBC_01727]